MNYIYIYIDTCDLYSLSPISIFAGDSVYWLSNSCLEENFLIIGTCFITGTGLYFLIMTYKLKNFKTIYLFSKIHKY